MNNLYEVLGVGKNATPDEIKKAYRSLSLKWHPDRHTNDSEEKKKEAEEKFKEISEAYSILSDSEKKLEYDTYGSVGNRGPEIDPNDIFAKFASQFQHFGNFGFNSNANHQRSNIIKGKDKKIRINVTLEELYNGGSKEVSYEVYEKCDKCNGTGSQDGMKKVCPHCGGMGFITETRQFGNTMMQSSHTCPHCGGNGFVVENPCPECNGTGAKSITKTDKFTIPTIDDFNQFLKFPGRGHAPIQGNGINGDLYVTFAIINDENSKFYLSPHYPYAICQNVEVSVFDCITGGELEVDTIGKKRLKVKLPQGTQHNGILKVPKYGLKDMYGRPGDMLIYITTKMPEKLSKKQVEKINELKKEIEK